MDDMDDMSDMEALFLAFVLSIVMASILAAPVIVAAGYATATRKILSGQ